MPAIINTKTFSSAPFDQQAAEALLGNVAKLGATELARLGEKLKVGGVSHMNGRLHNLEAIYREAEAIGNVVKNKAVAAWLNSTESA